MNMTLTVPALGSEPAKSKLPVAALGEAQTVGTILQNCYIQELLAPRFSGSLLNIGAGTASEKFRHAEMFGVETYHTLEPDASMRCTFVASATDMKPVPSESYDWVVSTAVIEHVDDPWAAAREHVRAAKPGGHIYVVFPFEQVMHAQPSFGDYWRFTPQGARTLFAGCQVLEVETWGEHPLSPNGFSLLLRKPGGVASVPPAERYYWLEFPNDEPFALTVPQKPPTYEWTLREMLLEPMRLGMEISRVRDQLTLQTGIALTGREVGLRTKEDYSRRIGRFGCRNGVSFFDREA